MAAEQKLATRKRRLLAPILIVGGLLLFNVTAMLIASSAVERQRLQQRLSGLVASTPARGFLSRRYIDDDGSEHPYTLFVPHDRLPGRTLPLLIYLNGFGENGKDGRTILRNGIGPAIWDDEQRFPFAVLWVQCGTGDSWNADGPSKARALAIIDQVVDDFQIDKDRLYLSGISAGASGSWSIAAKHPHLFAAIVPVSGTGSGTDIQAIIAARMPVWGYFNRADTAAFVEPALRAQQQMLAAGMSSHLTELQSGTEPPIDPHDAWSFAFRDGGLYRWLARQRVSNRRKEPPPFKSITPNTIFATELPSSQIAEGHIKIPAEITRQPRLLARQQFGAGLEAFHLEFRPTPGVRRIGIGWFSQTDANPAHGIIAEIAIRDVNGGGLFSSVGRACLYPSWSVGEHSLRTNGWNDLRLDIADGRISLELNGWPLLNRVDAPLPTSEMSWGIIVDGAATESVEFRDMRVRSTPEPSLAKTASERPRPAVPTTDALSDLQTIATAWRRREARFPDVELEWTRHDSVRFAGELFRPNPQSSRPRPIPASSRERVVIAGNATQYSTRWPHRRMNILPKYGLLGRSSPLDYRRASVGGFAEARTADKLNLQFTAFADEQCRTDQIFKSESIGHRGVIFERPDVWKARIGELDDVLPRGAFLAFRPIANSGIRCQLDLCHVLPDIAWMAGVKCNVVSEISNLGTNVVERRFYVDPTRDFLILASKTLIDGNVREQVDVEYVHKPDLGWMPSGWTATVTPSIEGTLTNSDFPGHAWVFNFESAQNVEYHLAEPAKSYEFRKTFRPGTITLDSNRKEWFIQATSHDRKPLSAQEAKYLLLDEEPRRPSGYGKAWVGVVAFLGIAGFVGLYRRQSRGVS